MHLIYEITKLSAPGTSLAPSWIVLLYVVIVRAFQAIYNVLCMESWKRQFQPRRFRRYIGYLTVGNFWMHFRLVSIAFIIK